MSSNQTIAGQVLVDTEGIERTTIVINSVHGSINGLANTYESKAMSSLDGVFRVFSTNTSDVDLPHFEEPTEGADNPTVEDLNPFEESDIQIITPHGSLPDNLFSPDSNDYKSISLRGPVIITGWGYDTDGNPVPNEDEENPTSNFLSNYKTRTTEWKTGPLDVRWSTTRKVWVATGATVSVRIVHVNPTTIYSDSITNNDLNPFRKRVYLATIYNLTIDESEFRHGGEVNLENTNEQIYVASFRNIVLPNSLYLATNINGYWVLDSHLGFVDNLDIGA